MCGITGFIDFSSKLGQTELEAMQHSLRHRGPDDKGIALYQTDICHVGLAHTRLSVIDISVSGHQPMIYGNYSIIFNGEIYNFQQIKDELTSLGHSFKSTSDTEVVLHSFIHWGMACVDRFIGMFAFVIFDAEKLKVYACRDRVGVKPFFYYWKNGLFLFASELKAFHQIGLFEKSIDSEALFLYLQYGYVPSPHSIFKSTFKLNPGTWLELDLKEKALTQKSYWTLEEVFQAPILSISYAEAKAELKRLLQSACQYRMVADVPVGLFLSGGYDSTLVASMLQTSSSKKLKTFTIGFPDGVDESPHAKAIANFLGTDHSSYDCTESDAKSIIPDLPYYYDEPTADISNIPTILVSRLAKKQVTVALSADGGDELFGGYDGFKDSLNHLRNIDSIPFPRITGRLLHSLGLGLPDSVISFKRKALGLGRVLGAVKAERVKMLTQESSDIPSFYVASLLKNSVGINHPAFLSDWSLFNDQRNGLLYNAFKGSLQDLLLVKMDRATMSISLEGREPLLDHRLIEYAARMPFEYKHNGVTGKRILKDIVYEYVPRQLMDRRKVGFDLPLYKWLRSDLAFLVEENLNAVSEEFFDKEAVQTIKRDFFNGSLHYQTILWRILSFQMWYKQWC